MQQFWASNVRNEPSLPEPAGRCAPPTLQQQTSAPSALLSHNAKKRRGTPE